MPTAMRPMSFYETITAAVNDVMRHGFDSEERVRRWMDLIRAAADRSLRSPQQLESVLNAYLGTLYDRLVVRGGMFKRHPGVSRFQVQRLTPQMRAELDRRVLASANLIKLNRTAAIESCGQRFIAWSTSIPAGGSKAPDRVKVKTQVRKSMAALPFEERRVLIDQGHKFTAALDKIVAASNGAIAATWHSHWRQANYNYRPDHKERDGKVYLVRDGWAYAKGLVKPGKDGFLDDITQAGEEVFCRCWCSYVYALREMPAAMLTARGKTALEAVRVA